MRHSICLCSPQIESAPKMPTASPASTRNVRQHGEAGKPSPDSAKAMPPAPPPKRRTLRSGACSTLVGDGLELPPAAGACSSFESAASMGAASTGTEGAGALKRLQKRLREAERLQLRQENGDALSAEEHIKAESAAVLRVQIALLVQPATPTTAGAVIGSAHSSGAAASAAPTKPAASRVAAACNQAVTALQALPAVPPTRVGTRATALAVEQQMREEREALERERLIRAERSRCRGAGLGGAACAA